MHKLTLPLGPLYDAGINILHQHGKSLPAIKDHTYDVKHYCCGKRETLLHRTITSKAATGRDKCRVCSERVGRNERKKKQVIRQ